MRRGRDEGDDGNGGDGGDGGDDGDDGDDAVGAVHDGGAGRKRESGKKKSKKGPLPRDATDI